MARVDFVTAIVVPMHDKQTQGGQAVDFQLFLCQSYPSQAESPGLTPGVIHMVDCLQV